MSGDGRNTVPEFVQDVVGDVAGEESGREGAVAREFERVTLAMALALPPETPAPASRGRLLVSATAGPMRYAPFFDRLARMFDLGRDAVVRVLERAASESEWEPGPHPSLRVLHFPGGPSVAKADTGLVRMPADFAWPLHRHGGIERVLILEGAYTEVGGRVYRAGDIHEMGPGSEHAFTVAPGAPLLFAIVLFGGFHIL